MLALPWFRSTCIVYKLEITKQMANAANVMIIPKTTVSPLSPKNENYLQNTTFQNEMSKKKIYKINWSSQQNVLISMHVKCTSMLPLDILSCFVFRSYLPNIDFSELVVNVLCVDWFDIVMVWLIVVVVSVIFGKYLFL